MGSVSLLLRHSLYPRKAQILSIWTNIQSSDHKQSGPEITLQPMSTNFGAFCPDDVVDHQDHQLNNTAAYPIIITADMSAHMSTLFSPRVHGYQGPDNDVVLSSAYPKLPQAAPGMQVPLDIVGGREGLYGIKYERLEKQPDCLQRDMYKPTTFSLDMNVAEVGAPIDMLNNGNSNNLMVADVVPPAEVGDKLQNEEDPQLAQISQKNSAPSSNCAVADPHVTVTIAAQSSTSGTCDRILGNHLVQTTSQVAVDSRHRRARLTKGVKALQKLLPNVQEMGGREHVLDSATDYVKLLKLQIRALSQSRLGGEATVGPFSHLAEYGHYLCHEQMVGEPLEETMRRLMEVDMPAARKFLESKGLHLVPQALATDPSQNY